MNKELLIHDYVRATPMPEGVSLLQFGHWVGTSDGNTYRVTVVIEDIINAAEATNPSPPSKQAHKG